MSRKYTLKEDVYLVLAKYFKGKVVMLNKKDLEDLNKNTFEGEDITPINPVLLKELKKILKARDKGGFDFIFPKWSNDTSVVKKKLNQQFPMAQSSTPTAVSNWGDVPDDVMGDEPAPEPKPEPTQKHEPKPSVKPVSEPKEIKYTAEHSKWDDDIIFYSNKTFKKVQKKGESGQWTINKNTLTLKWKKWDPEELISDDNGKTFTSEKIKFILTLKSDIELPSWFKVSGKTSTIKPKEKQDVKEYDINKPFTIKKLNKDIKALTDNPNKNKEEIDILDKLKGIGARTNIQFRSLHVNLQKSLQFNFVSSFSTTEFSIADEMSQFILETVGEKIRSSNKGK